MSRSALLVVVLIAIGFAVAAAWFTLTRSPAARTDADVVSDRRAMPPFRQVLLEGNAEVTLVQGASEALAAQVYGRSVVHADVRDGVLRVRSDDDRRWWTQLFGANRRAPQITITVRDLDALRASGSIKLACDALRVDALTLRFSGAAEVTIAALQARTLAINGSGAFKADIAGHVDEQRISISGAGDYRGSNLVSDRASVRVSGAGRVVVDAQKTLDVEVSGAAKVDYKGDPTITKRVGGAARVRRYEGAQPMMPIAALTS